MLPDMPENIVNVKVFPSECRLDRNTVAQAMNSTKKTILLVDDSPMICHAVGKILRETGYEVLVAKNGRDGCILAKKHDPRLIIMDVEMPVMDGIQAAILIKSEPETNEIPILIFTSLGGEEDIKRARAAGCQGFLNKPISKEAIRTEVQKFLGNP
jgi:CheY-like chemotaxis protein